jgi:hypothetical protein
MGALPGAAEARLPQQPYNNLRRAFPGIGEEGLALLNGLLTYDPSRRLTARQALAHPYFQAKPHPKQPWGMPTFPSSHEPGHKGVLQQRGPRADIPYAADSPPPRGAGGGAGGRRAPPAAEARGQGVDADGGRWGDVFGSGPGAAARGAGAGSSLPAAKRPRLTGR